MKVLLVIAHADPKKEATAYRLAKAAEEALVAAGNEVKTTDLIHEGFDKNATEKDFNKLVDGPFGYINNQTSEDNLIPEIQRQHELIKWATHLIIIGPMWFYRLPGCFYSWIDRVFTMNFAFDYGHSLEKGLLADKKASIIITCGGTKAHFDANGYAPLEACLYSSTYGLKYAGLKVTRTLAYFSANEPEVVQKEAEYIEKFKKAVLQVDSWPLLPRLFTHPKDGEKNEAEIFSRLEPLTVEDLVH